MRNEKNALFRVIMHDYLTARELADLLRIKERKLYELASDGAIPVTKVTGKLLFPRDAIMAWLNENTEYGGITDRRTDRPHVVAGSHDPLLEWALRQSGCGLATWFDGSADGVARMKRGEALAAGIHFDGHGNADRIRLELPSAPLVLIEWAKRSQGLVVADGSPIRGLKDLPGKIVVQRQPGAGSQTLFEKLISENGLSMSDLSAVSETARSETDVAQAVASGRVEAGFGIETVARQFGLGFIPLTTERFDLMIWRRDYFYDAFQKLMAVTRTDIFRERAAELGGYDVSDTGRVRYNGP